MILRCFEDHLVSARGCGRLSVYQQHGWGFLSEEWACVWLEHKRLPFEGRGRREKVGRQLNSSGKGEQMGAVSLTSLSQHLTLEGSFPEQAEKQVQKEPLTGSTE